MATAYEDAELIAEIKRLAAEIGDTPSTADMAERGKYSRKVYYNNFDSWTAALKQAGMRPKQANSVSKDELLSEIHRLADGDGPPASTDMNEDGEYSASTYHNNFGSWSEALIEAGYDPESNLKGHGIPKDALLDDIQRLGQILDRAPRVKDVIDKGEFSPTAYYNNFGSWNAALSEAGFELNNATKTVECHICGDTKDVPRYYARDFDKQFCSKDCCIQWRSERWQEDKNPRWREYVDIDADAHKSVLYGPDWPETRENIVESQDRRCRVCTRHESEVTQNLHVHHIQPVYDFVEDGVVDWDRANDAENLVALCNRCHPKWEGMPVLPDSLSAQQ